MPPKNTPKGDISGITKKDDIHSRFILILLDTTFIYNPRKGTRSSHRRCPTGKGVLRNFAKFTGKDLCQSLFFNKATDLRPATLLKKEALAQVVSCEFCEISKNTFFTERPQAAASGVSIIPCSFMETFIDVFIYCFPVKEKQET